MTDTTRTIETRTIETDVPARLDRLPFGGWHFRIVAALGTSWLLDGLQVTLAGALAGIMKDPKALGLSDTEVTGGATAYLAGAVVGALFFGYLTDRLGRRKLFLITLAVYTLATGATALSWNFTSFIAFRFVTGLGIGGEYAAINSAVDELIPSKVRGMVDLFVNATFWLGAVLGIVASYGLVNSQLASIGLISVNMGWRLAFGVAALLGFAIFSLRFAVPESPRWLMLRGREKEAEDIVAQAEQAAGKKHIPLPPVEGDTLRIQVRDHTPWREIVRSICVDHRQRSILGLVLMIGQAFFFNAVFFSFGLVVEKFYNVDAQHLPLYLLPFAVACFFGPLLLGHFFDRIGRKPMIAATYGIAAVLLIVATVPFARDGFSALTLDLYFTVVFFVASSAASAAYLTVSEIFPLEVRALAIAIFYAVGTLIGGVGAPLLFGTLIATGSRLAVCGGYLLGGVLMLIGAVVEVWMGVEAAGKSLESLAQPLQSRKS